MRNKIFGSKQFSLVLSGGGALGIAHLGVFEDMEAYALVPSEIIGTSMGGIIGACIAMGQNKDEISKNIQQFASITNWLKFSFNGNSVVEKEKLSKIFDRLFGEAKMGDTRIPLKLIATNLRSSQKRVFDKNDDIYIKDAILATMAIPGIFPEQTIEGEVYGDGFLCQNLGILEASYEEVIAVDVLGQHSFNEEMPNNFFKTSNVLEMFEKSMRLLIYNQTKLILEHSSKNIYLIEPVTKAYKTYHFHKVEEISALGLGLL